MHIQFPSQIVLDLLSILTRRSFPADKRPLISVSLLTTTCFRIPSRPLSWSHPQSHRPLSLPLPLLDTFPRTCKGGLNSFIGEIFGLERSNWKTSAFVFQRGFVTDLETVSRIGRKSSPGRGAVGSFVYERSCVTKWNRKWLKRRKTFW
jgi:hypothetical protein